MITKILSDLEIGQISTDTYGRIIIDSNLSEKIMLAIREKRIPLVLDESDVRITFANKGLKPAKYGEEAFNSLDDIVAVHVSSVSPQKDTIKTKENAGMMNKMVFIDPATSQQHVVPYLIGNDTIHFTLNCVVQNHSSGNDWNSFKYGVLIDFKKIDKTKILDVKGEDTYIMGNAQLDSDYLLFCPFGEGKKLMQDNPNAIVIEYNGISLAQAISCMIVYTGHKLEPYGTYSWGRNSEYALDHPDVSKLEEIAKREGYPVLKGQFGNALHSETEHMARIMWKREYEALINLIEYNRKENIKMPDAVLFQVMVYGMAYSLPGTVPVTLENYKKTVIPILNKYGYYVDSSLFNGIEDNETMKIIYFDAGIPIVNCPIWENILRDRVIKLLKEEKNKKIKQP